MFKKYEYLEHTADVKFRAYGRNLNKLFKNSVKAMFKHVYKGKVKKKDDRKIKVKGENLENLLYNFLEEFIFIVETEGILFSDFKYVEVNKEKLEAEAIFYGDFIENYELSFDIKAITYNDMFVKKEKGRWVSQVVLDV